MLVKRYNRAAFNSIFIFIEGAVNNYIYSLNSEVYGKVKMKPLFQRIQMLNKLIKEQFGMVISKKLIVEHDKEIRNKLVHFYLSNEKELYYKINSKYVSDLEKSLDEWTCEIEYITGFKSYYITSDIIDRLRF